jgi:hypothetical protein
MQVTSPMQPIAVFDDVVEAPGRHRRNRHEPRMCAVCAAPLAGQAGACWRCGTGVPEPVRNVVLRAVRATPRPALRHAPVRPMAQEGHGGRTPLWTRHTRGAIEAGRDRRLESRASAPIRYRTAPAAATNVLRPDFAADRWANEGGTVDREAAVAVRGYSQLVGSDGLVPAR